MATVLVMSAARARRSSILSREGTKARGPLLLLFSLSSAGVAALNLSCVRRRRSLSLILMYTSALSRIALVAPVVLARVRQSIAPSVVLFPCLYLSSGIHCKYSIDSLRAPLHQSQLKFVEIPREI